MRYDLCREKEINTELWSPARRDKLHRMTLYLAYKWLPLFAIFLIIVSHIKSIIIKKSSRIAGKINYQSS